MTTGGSRTLRRRAAGGIGASVMLALSASPGNADPQTKPADPSNPDWGQVARYAAADAALQAAAPDRGRVVFYGDSITDYWIVRSPDFFADKPYVDRGIAGQTTWQMLIRFQQDVIRLRPRIVVILGGINDLGGHMGPSTNAMIEDNLASMSELAASHGIRPILCSVLPVRDPARRERIADLNRWIAHFAQARGYGFVDYFPAVADAEGRMPARLSADGVHPNADGYAIMQPLVSDAIARTPIRSR